jgi:hypothetical protein
MRRTTQGWPCCQAQGGAATPREADPAKMPSWQNATSDTLESAALEERPLVIYFPGEKDTDFTIYGDEFSELSKTDAVFVKIPYTADREVSPWDEESVVPTSKLLSANPSLAYDIKVGEPTVLVCDWFGNKYFETNEKVKADKLQVMIEKVADEVEDVNNKLQKYLEKAQAEHKDGDIKGALKNLLKNFDDGEGPVGLPAQEESIRLYHEIMDNCRTRMEELRDKGDIDGLKDLRRKSRRRPWSRKSKRRLKTSR